jgi:quinol monooxygenase YgiN
MTEKQAEEMIRLLRQIVTATQAEETNRLLKQISSRLEDVERAINLQE